MQRSVSEKRATLEVPGRPCAVRNAVFGVRLRRDEPGWTPPRDGFVDGRIYQWGSVVYARKTCSPHEVEGQ